MINTEVLEDAEQRRLAWRCRRGMLELDIVLQRFIKEKFGVLSIKELEVFDGLLDLPDNQFWALINDSKTHQDKHLNHILSMLNASSRLVLKDF